MFWIGGTGVWNDNSNWSLSSGGTGGECQPSMQDNVIFDANSFSPSGDTVYVHPTLGVYVNNLTFTSIPNATVLYSSSGNSAINVSGSLTMPAELNLYSVVLKMTSSVSGNTLSSGGNSFTEIIFAGSGDWTLQDDLSASNFSAVSGTFISDGHAINVGGVNLGGNATLDFGTSTITVIGFWSNYNVTIIGGDANLIMTSSFLSIQPAGAHFNSITFTGTANTTSNFSCNYLIANGNFTNINSIITAGTATFKSDVRLPLNFICDTLILDNPGNLVEISNMTVNGDMICNGNSGFPIQIEGYNGAGVIQKSSGQICIEYVLIKDIQAIGGAQFFAGNTSVNLGGNSGWSFTSCVPPASNVWPGDANYDLTADNNDILNIGLAFGYSGPVRSGASLAWSAQPATDWSAQFANGANLKHADTDGSGSVDNDDTTAVSLNYGLTHPFRLLNPSATQLPAPVLYVTTNPDTASTSDTVEVSIFLGTNSSPVDSIYGIAFTVNFDTALVNTSYMNPDFSGCWLGTSSVDLITFNKDLLQQGRVDITLVRTDQQNSSGFGFLGRLGIVIVDNVGAKITLPVTLSNITAITAGEYIVPVAFENDSIIIDTTGTVGILEPIIDNEMISLYPNPADQFVQVISAELKIEKYTIYNQYGIQLSSKELLTDKFKLNTSGLSQGVYTIRFFTEKGTITKKFLVVRK
ncbi:MAG: T9SS type A sorting domain-containing protein [Bacteroidetes bacterium]|nr:T9SS type A sorting domain-containing protein [Bacteroidota bacterium]